MSSHAVTSLSLSKNWLETQNAVAEPGTYWEEEIQRENRSVHPRHIICPQSESVELQRKKYYFAHSVGITSTAVREQLCSNSFISVYFADRSDRTVLVKFRFFFLFVFLSLPVQ